MSIDQTSTQTTQLQSAISRAIPVPSPRPTGSAVRSDGIRVVGYRPALPQGVTYGRALRVDFYLAPSSVVYVAAEVEVRELGDDQMLEAHTGSIRGDLDTLWPNVMGGVPADTQVLMNVFTSSAAVLSELVTTLPNAPARLVHLGIDPELTPGHRLSFALPQVSPAVIEAHGTVRTPLSELGSTSGAQSSLTAEELKLRSCRRDLARLVPGLVQTDAVVAAGPARTIFADGSVLKGSRIGAGAAVSADGRWMASPLRTTLPLAAELHALTLALVLAGSTCTGGTVLITTDSKYAIDLFRKAQADPVGLGGAKGAKVRDEVRRLRDALAVVENAGITVTVKWVKGHAGHAANEHADALARSTARNSLNGLAGDALVARLNASLDLALAA